MAVLGKQQMSGGNYITHLYLATSFQIRAPVSKTCEGFNLLDFRVNTFSNLPVGVLNNFKLSRPRIQMVWFAYLEKFFLLHFAKLSYRY